ncbi:MAG TPA: RnfABCDGE type electron transport complex subunit C [Gammaproteobacteria bacterium]|nr:RnfABCDGE type electron transport complex subunit C [Gammaproteobacteria bacterium]
MGAVLRGVTLPKKLTAPLELIEIAPPTQVVLPFIQHLGEPAQPTVQVGDKVTSGQLIAAAATDHTVPLYAPLTGTVTAFTATFTSRGQDTEALVIEGTEEGPKTNSPPDPASLSPVQLTDTLRTAGLLTPGLAPVPLISELLPPEQPAARLPLTGRGVVKAIDTLLITALDPEPSLGVNRYLAGIESPALSAGITALRTITGADQVVIAVDSTLPSPPPLAALAAADEQEATTMVRLNNRRYPVGLPIPLIKAALGREVPLPYGRPRDVGVALITTAAALSLGETLVTGTPPVSTYISVGGGGLGKAGIVKIPLGTTIGDLVQALGGFTRQPAKLVIGGPMTGFAHYDLTVPLGKDAGGLFALTPEEITPVGAYRQCINCGRCVAVCPVNLVPGMLSMYCARDRFEEAAARGLLACIECGCCDYVCPSRRPLVHLFRHAKHQLTEEGA